MTTNSKGSTAEFQKLLSDVLSPAENYAGMLNALNQIIADHLEVDAANVPKVMALTYWPTEAHSQAASMMLDRGLEQLTTAQRKKFSEGKLPLSEQPFPMSTVVNLALGNISLMARGRDDIVQAVTGQFNRLKNRHDDDEGERRGQDIHIHNEGKS